SVTVADGGKGRGQNHALDSGVARGTQNTESALARRTNQIVLVLGRAKREGGGYMQHVLTAGGRLGPTNVAFEVSDCERKSVIGWDAALFQHGPHAGLALRRTDRGAYLVTGRQQLCNAVRGDEAGASGDENGTHSAVRKSRIKAMTFGPWSVANRCCAWAEP